MASRIFLCVTAACCLVCLAPPMQGLRRRPVAGLQQGAAGAGGLVGGRRSRLLLHQQLPVPVPVPVPDQTRFVPTSVNEELRRGGVPVTATSTTKKPRRPAAAAAAWSVVMPELRDVPGGPDPLHHHGGSPSRRPEEQDHRTPSP